VNDSGHTSDVSKELISQAGSLRGTLDEACDVPHLDLGGDYLLWLACFVQGADLLVINTYLGHIRVDCAEWVVFRLGHLSPR
jgi:hypothetical protein